MNFCNSTRHNLSLSSFSFPLQMSTAKQTQHHPPHIPWKFLVFFCIALATSLFLFISYSLSTDFHPKPFKHLVQHHTINTVKYSSTAGEEEPTNISHIFFGIAGSAKTWPKRRPYVDLWWQPNITRGYLWMDEKPPENETWPETSPPYKVSGNTSSFKYTCWYGSRSAIRIARIVKETFELAPHKVRWFVMGDDDTVFFTDNLVTVLSKYDHNQMYYVGANSESVEQDVIFSYGVAYGGGGIAVSYPLAAELARILDGCIDRYAQLYGGDQKVQACISEIGVPLTKELGFHQVDIRGNPFGLLAAHPVAPLVSLHHLESVDQLFPSLPKFESIKKLVGAYKMDPGRILEHSFCYDLKRNWSISVSWGHSVQLYLSLVSAKELEKAVGTFQTWQSQSDGPFGFNTRPVSSDPCRRPVLFFLDRVENMDAGNTRSTYVRYVDALGKECGRLDLVGVLDVVQLVNVSAPYHTPDLWKKVAEGAKAAGASRIIDIDIDSNKFERVMDRSWMQQNRLSEEYEKGVEEFLNFAQATLPKSGETFSCPCVICVNQTPQIIDKIREHLIVYGICSSYTTWTWHGEKKEMSSVSEGKKADVEMDDRLEDMIRDIGHESFKRAHVYESLTKDNEEALYKGCTKFTRLSAVLRLCNLKAINVWTDESFTYLLELLKDMLPEGNTLPNRAYDAKKILCPMGVEYKKIHACRNECILYRKEFENVHKCPTCGLSRYKVKDGVDSCDDESTKGAPAKVLSYLPIISRLKRLFANEKDAKSIRWHVDERKCDGQLRHPADSLQWKKIDTLFPDFGSEPRNIRLGLASDGMNPYSNLSSNHSSWLVVLVVYNLSPWLCMKRKYMMLSMMISGPKQPGNDIDVFLNPLIEDLRKYLFLQTPLISYTI